MKPEKQPKVEPNAFFDFLILPSSFCRFHIAPSRIAFSLSGLIRGLGI
jgi:hypothetical protein